MYGTKVQKARNSVNSIYEIAADINWLPVLNMYATTPTTELIKEPCRVTKMKPFPTVLFYFSLFHKKAEENIQPTPLKFFKILPHSVY